MKKYKDQILFILLFFVAWEILFSLNIFPDLLFPSLSAIYKSLINGFVKDSLAEMILYSLSLLVKGLFIGILLSFVLSSLSIINTTFKNIYNLLISVFDLIPGVALIPLAILWFGIGEGPIIFIVIHSIVWPMSRNIIDGFQSVPKIYIESGMNLGLSRWELIKDIYIPAAFSSLLSGMKIGWARAWRGLISAEMIFGTTSSGAGLGWFIFMKRTNVDIAGVFAALIVIIIIGIIVEYGFFHTLEKHTIKKWGVRS